MNFLTAFRYELLKNLRDVKMLVLIVLFPVVTSYLIGSAVSGFFKPDDGKAIEAAYVNMDKGAVGMAFDSFITSDEVAQRLHAKGFPDLEQGRRALSDGTCTALVYLPGDLTEGLLRGERRTITVEGKEDAELVKMLSGGFSSAFNANAALAGLGLPPAVIEPKESVVRVNRIRRGVYPNLTDYYSVLVLLEALVIGAIFGAHITARQYGSDIHIRTGALPVRPWTLLFGRIAGSTAYLMLTSAATILFTKYVYGVDWGGNLPVLLGTLAVFNFIVIALGVLCGSVCKRISTSITVIFVLMFFFGTVSGSVSPRSGVVALGYLTPNYYAKLLMFGSMYGYPDSVMLSSALWLAGMAAAVFLAVMLVTRRPEHGNL